MLVIGKEERSVESYVRLGELIAKGAIKKEAINFDTLPFNERSVIMFAVSTGIVDSISFDLEFLADIKNNNKQDIVHNIMLTLANGIFIGINEVIAINVENEKELFSSIMSHKLKVLLGIDNSIFSNVLLEGNRFFLDPTSSKVVEEYKVRFIRVNNIVRKILN